MAWCVPEWLHLAWRRFAQVAHATNWARPRLVRRTVFSFRVASAARDRLLPAPAACASRSANVNSTTPCRAFRRGALCAARLLASLDLDRAHSLTLYPTPCPNAPGWWMYLSARRASVVHSVARPAVSSLSTTSWHTPSSNCAVSMLCPMTFSAAATVADMAAAWRYHPARTRCHTPRLCQGPMPEPTLCAPRAAAPPVGATDTQRGSPATRGPSRP